MEAPYFSVVIPTKNRSSILMHAIQSILQQTFRDFEIVIADNDDGPQTRQLVDGLKEPQIQYFRSGNLSMTDNWEFAISKARGEYVLVIEDKQALKLTALEILFNLTRNHKYGCITWTRDGFSDTHGKRNRIRIAKTSGKIYKVSSDIILKKFLSRRAEEFDREFPLGYLIAIHRDVIARVKEGPLKGLCIPVSPDYSMAFAMLYYNDYIIYIDRALALATTNKVGTGKDCRVKGPGFYKYVKELGKDIRYYYDHVPIKIVSTFNCIYNDYMRIRHILGGKLLQHDLDLPNYFTQSYKDIQHGKLKKVNVSDDEAAWTQAYLQQPKSVQSAIDAMIKNRIDSHNTIINRLSRQINKLKKLFITNTMLFRNALECNDMTEGWVNIKMHFDNPIDYLIWEKDNTVYKTINYENIIEQ